MFHCTNCGFDKSHELFVDEVFQINGRRVLVERIPAIICDRCGEKTFSRETTGKIRKLVHSSAQPVRAEELAVFEFV